MPKPPSLFKTAAPSQLALGTELAFRESSWIVRSSSGGILYELQPHLPTLGRTIAPAHRLVGQHIDRSELRPRRLSKRHSKTPLSSAQPRGHAGVARDPRRSRTHACVAAAAAPRVGSPRVSFERRTPNAREVGARRGARKARRPPPGPRRRRGHAPRRRRRRGAFSWLVRGLPGSPTTRGVGEILLRVGR